MKSLRTTIAFFLLLIPTSGLFAADSTSVVKVGLTIRSRIETNDYASTLGFTESPNPITGNSYYRQRTGLMVRVMPMPKYELGIRLTNEFRRYFAPAGSKNSYDEVVIDQLYLKGDSIAGTPFSAIIGRQNIMLGEGFLIADGSPLDGSRTAYFNAVNVGWQLSGNTSVRMIYFNQQQEDDILPVIHDQHKLLLEGDEKGAILYLVSTIEELTLEPYVIRMERDRSKALPHAAIGCAGLRLRAEFTPQFIGTGEMALQFGDWGAVDQKALGSYTYVEYKTNLPTYFPSGFTLGGVYLSGDKEETKTHEGFDPLYGRWPKWSESYVYMLTNETALAYWSNFASLFCRTAVPIGADLTLGLEYHHLLAPVSPSRDLWEEVPVFFHVTSRYRGDLSVIRLNYRIKPRLSGHLLYEHFDPKSFYVSWAKPSTWMRMEMMLTF